MNKFLLSAIVTASAFAPAPTQTQTWSQGYVYIPKTKLSYPTIQMNYIISDSQPIYFTTFAGANSAQGLVGGIGLTYQAKLSSKLTASFGVGSLFDPQQKPSGLALIGAFTYRF